MDEDVLPWGGVKTPEEIVEKKFRKEELEDFKLALRYGWLLLPEEVLNLIEWQHYYYELANFEQAGRCFNEALQIFVDWRINNYGEYEING